MALIASISGVRGTIGGTPGQNLTPLDIVKFASAYATWLRRQGRGDRVVVGRDARLSGEMVSALVTATLNACGLHVVQLGLTTTPTVEMAVPRHQAAGGIILTASHNPVQWNALKLLNHDGEFLSAAAGAEILALYDGGSFDYVHVDHLGGTQPDEAALDAHIQAILAHPLVDAQAVGAAGFRVVVDAVNSTGGIAVPALLRALGVHDVAVLHGEPTGRFAHNPEPLKEHLGDICAHIAADPGAIGIVVDPDVDRLALVMENGELFGEEYTLVAVADYVLRHQPGPVVSNLSSSRALADVAARYGCLAHAAAVGEVNVVAKMKSVNAVLGGEGNGGIIVPELHYGRDALAGIALVLTHLARTGSTLQALRASYPEYHMAKQKIELQPGLDVDALLDAFAAHMGGQSGARLDRQDGVKVDLPDGWMHLRKSNTEPIVRIYTEAATPAGAEALAQAAQAVIQSAVQA